MSMSMDEGGNEKRKWTRAMRQVTAPPTSTALSLKNDREQRPDDESKTSLHATWSSVEQSSRAGIRLISSNSKR